MILLIPISQGVQSWVTWQWLDVSQRTWVTCLLCAQLWDSGRSFGATEIVGRFGVSRAAASREKMHNVRRRFIGLPKGWLAD